MVFGLMPREVKFFDWFEQMAATLSRAASKFLAMVTDAGPNLTALSADLREEEHACDKLVEQIILALDRSFITPFDREDIHALATSLDDVMDNIEETAHRLVAFQVGKPTPEAVVLAQLVNECCSHLSEAVHKCRDLKNAAQIQQHLREIGRLENEADLVYRNTDTALFANPPDILQLIKWRELYGWLEETIDSCKAVANVISEIVIKGS